MTEEGAKSRRPRGLSASGTQRIESGPLALLLAAASRAGASDLHLTVGTQPLIRVNGELSLLDHLPLTAENIRKMVETLMNADQIAAFERDWQICFSIDLPSLGYFRVTLYSQRGNVEAAIRLGAVALRPFEDLGLPMALAELARKPNGLILITGPTGAGKTTTFNALIDLVNRERRAKIITIEDPVEHLHANKKSVVVQQEIFTDAKSFSKAMIHVLRQDPDVIGIGELLDYETVAAALTAAETGHLVLGTLHSNDCVQTINRILDVLPESLQQQARYQLSFSLRGILNLRLLPRIDGQGRVPAYSLLVNTPAVQNLIRENKLSQVPNVMRTGKRDGMVVMDDLIRDYYQKALISYDVAMSHVTDAALLGAKG